jgi:hypothetical protein
MSQHHFNTEFKGQPCKVMMGWDRPLQGFFMTIEQADSDGETDFIYSNLDDPALFPFNGLPQTLEYFQEKLDELGLTLPPLMIKEINKDAARNVGNRFVTYDQDGNPNEDIPY